MDESNIIPRCLCSFNVWISVGELGKVNLNVEAESVSFSPYLFHFLAAYCPLASLEIIILKGRIHNVPSPSYKEW